MPIKRRQNLAETYYKGIILQRGTVRIIFDTAKVHFTMLMKVIMMMRVIMKIFSRTWSFYLTATRLIWASFFYTKNNCILSLRVM